MSNVILCNLSDSVNVVEEEKQQWIVDVLQSLGVPDEIIETKDIRDFRYEMEQLGIEVNLCTDGSVSIYKKQWHNGRTEETSDWLPPTKDHLIAEWKTPDYIKVVEGRDVYYEIHLNEWSIPSTREK